MTPARRSARAVWMQETFQIAACRACRLAGYSRAAWYKPRRTKELLFTALGTKEAAKTAAMQVQKELSDAPPWDKGDKAEHARFFPRQSMHGIVLDRLGLQDENHGNPKSRRDRRVNRCAHELLVPPGSSRPFRVACLRCWKRQANAASMSNSLTPVLSLRSVLRRRLQAGPPCSGRKECGWCRQRSWPLVDHEGGASDA